MNEKEKIINIAVIAHVDAGKSTLVDAFLRQSDVFRSNEEVVDCVMDSNDLVVPRDNVGGGYEYGDYSGSYRAN